MNKPPIHHALLHDGHLPQDTLLRYVRGELSPQEARQVELHELECELCAERLEGLQQAEAESPGAFEPDVTLLRERLRRRVAKERDSRIVVPLWPTMGRVAAGLAFLIVAGIAWRNWNQPRQQAEQIALLEQPTNADLVEDSLLAYQEKTEGAYAAEEALTTMRLEEKSIVAQPKRATALRESIADRPEPAAALPQPESVATLNDATKIEEASATVAQAPAAVSAPTTAAPAPTKMAAEPLVADEEANMAEKRKRAAKEEQVVKKAAPAAGLVQQANQSMKGKVLDGENGEALPGVNVLIKGTPVGTVTDMDGQFSLPVLSEGAVLLITYIGFKTQEIPLKPGQQSVEVQLEADHQALSEVVVVGYGAQPLEPSGYQAAAPEGGLKAFKQYVERNLRQPADAANVKGVVVAEGTIGGDGRLGNLRIIQSLHPSCDQEALRLLREGPRWQPAKRDGRTLDEPVRVRIRFGK